MVNQIKPKLTEQVKHQIAAGDTHINIAAKAGISRQTVGNIKRDHKEEIEQLTIDLLNKTLPNISKDHINQIQLSSDISYLINKHTITLINTIKQLL